jgi:hypothetical protein
MTDAPGAVNSFVLIRGLGQNAPMKPFGLLTGAAFTLAACAPLSIYYRPGASVARMQTDQLQCEVGALKQAPVANQVRQRPPIFYPGGRFCDSAGCYYTPGIWVDGGYYTVDVNADLRGRVEQQCMGSKGYQPVTLPLCSQSIKSQVVAQQTRTLPPLSEQSCSIRYDDGSWQIVTPIAAISDG